ncbi:unnamed protein product [Gordionus sp. m RMFG-2023]
MDSYKLEFIKSSDLSSELDVDGEQEDNKLKRYDLATKASKFAAHYPVLTNYKSASHHSEFVDKIDKEERGNRRNYDTLDAYSKHVKMVNDYITYYGGSIKELTRDQSKNKNLSDVIREEHKFIWNETDKADTWAKRVAKKYYDRLFREYCVVDLSLYQTSNIGMRWRTSKEVLSGKGQFICGEKSCTKTGNDLASWEVNFSYSEVNEKKNALVKARLCPECSVKLNFKHLHDKSINKNLKRKSTENDDINRKNKIKKTKKKKSKDKEINIDAEKLKDTHKIEMESESYFETQKTELLGDGSTSKVAQVKVGNDVWTAKSMVTKDNVEKSREEEFDEYFQDMFL